MLLAANISNFLIELHFQKGIMQFTTLIKIKGITKINKDVFANYLTQLPHILESFESAVRRKPLLCNYKLRFLNARK
jgi:hypothetical protein